ncbi:MAG: hypothetical protein MUF79_02300 [Burkholderiales bacterium]|jgi:hypothetical protein|nr:hypothetical protein [Burkholderiales bacterium]
MAMIGGAGCAAALLAGCGSMDSLTPASMRPWENTEPSARYSVLPGSSKQCETAAKRATYFCEGKMTFRQPGRIDDQNITDCNNAQQDFQRHCR